MYLFRNAFILGLFIIATCCTFVGRFGIGIIAFRRLLFSKLIRTDSLFSVGVELDVGIVVGPFNESSDEDLWMNDFLL
jgi:hypothetical protein